MYDFVDLDQVLGVLGGLASRETPLVSELPRQPGQKDERYAHLLAGDVTVAPSQHSVRQASTRAGPSQIETLEHAVEALRAEVADLRAELQSFRKQFE
ncbi:MAG: YceH family protein, partial [Gemmatimonadaceae bacterium]